MTVLMSARRYCSYLSTCLSQAFVPVGYFLTVASSAFLASVEAVGVRPECETACW